MPIVIAKNVAVEDTRRPSCMSGMLGYARPVQPPPCTHVGKISRGWRSVQREIQQGYMASTTSSTPTRSNEHTNCALLPFLTVKNGPSRRLPLGSDGRWGGNTIFVGPIPSAARKLFVVHSPPRTSTCRKKQNIMQQHRPSRSCRRGYYLHET